MSLEELQTTEGICLQAEVPDEPDLVAYQCGPHWFGDNLLIGAKCGDEDIHAIITGTGVEAIRHCGAATTTGHGDYFIDAGACWACAIHAAVKSAVADTLSKPPTMEQCLAYDVINALAFDAGERAQHMIEKQLVVVDGKLEYRRVVHEPREETP